MELKPRLRRPPAFRGVELTLSADRSCACIIGCASCWELRLYMASAGAGREAMAMPGAACRADLLFGCDPPKVWPTEWTGGERVSEARPLRERTWTVEADVLARWRIEPKPPADLNA